MPELPIDPADMETLCGQMAYFDKSCGTGFRCYTCNAMIGSIGMPKECKELYDMEDVILRLKRR
jgi:ferredoxin